MTDDSSRGEGNSFGLETHPKVSEAIRLLKHALDSKKTPRQKLFEKERAILKRALEKEQKEANVAKPSSEGERKQTEATPVGKQEGTQEGVTPIETGIDLLRPTPVPTEQEWRGEKVFMSGNPVGLPDDPFRYTTSCPPRPQASTEMVDEFYPKTLVVDFDGTISEEGARAYADAVPNTRMICALRKAYADGWSIMVDTARGYGSHDTERHRCMELTKRQLDEWGCPYDTLRVGVKIAGAYYIDDRSILPEKFIEGDF
jgi:hypothetical protein